MTQHQTAKIVLQGSGMLLMALGVVHLIATPEIPRLLNGLLANARDFAVGPTLLNHVLVGVLLLPLGFTTWFAASGNHLHERWARPILGVNCVAVLALPLSIVLFVRDPQYYRAPLFVIGVLLTAAIAVLVTAAAWVGASPRSWRRDEH